MILFIMLFAPAFVGTLLYEKLNPGPQTIFRLLTLTMSFVLITNLCVYAVIMYLGKTQLPWNERYISDIFFCIRYMGLSLVFAVIFAFLTAGLSLVSGGIKKWLKK